MQYSLQWENHHRNLNIQIGTLFKNSKFADVILLTTDKMIGIPCHKLILSASSQFFADMFERMPSQPGVTYVMMPSDLSYEAVRVLIHYMYNGESRVSNEILKEVLHGGDVLKVRGLYRGNESPQPQNKPPPKVQLKEAIKSSIPNETFMTIKEEPVEWREPSPIELHGLQVKDEVEVSCDLPAPPIPPPPDSHEFQKLSCEVCHESFGMPGDWVNHVEKHTEYSTTVLAKRRRRSDPGSLKGVQEMENTAALRCDLCLTSFGTPADWVKHIQSSHTELELAMENDKRARNGIHVSESPAEWHEVSEGPSNLAIRRIPTKGCLKRGLK